MHSFTGVRASADAVALDGAEDTVLEIAGVPAGEADMAVVGRVTIGA